jgi:hypothetical protein
MALWSSSVAECRPSPRMDPLRVPKRRIVIDVSFADGESHRVAVFLAERASTHDGPERIADLFNAEQEFIPAVEIEGGAMTFLSRAAIAVVRSDEPDWDRDEINLPVEHEVEVLLDSRQSLRGLLSYVLPPERCRVVDYLNEAAPFFALIEDGRAALVNKRHVRRVVLR